MTTAETISLNSAMHTCWEEMRLKGDYTFREVAVLVVERYPDVVAPLQAELVVDQITERIRKMVGRTRVGAEVPSEQLALDFPEELRRLDLPTTITVLVSEDGQEVERCIDLPRAKLRDIKAYLSMLRRQIMCDQRRARDVETFYNYCVGVMGEEAEDIIGPVLKAIAEQQRRRKATVTARALQPRGGAA